MAARRDIYPIPLQEMWENRAYIALPAAARGMLLTICEHFWKTGCVPLPKDDDQLFAIARAHRPTWRAHKAMILNIFKEIQPGLEAYFRKREGNRAGLIEASARSNSRRRLEALAEKRPSHAVVSGAVLIPKKDAIQSNRPAPPGQRERTRLTDRI
jgi:uncharacterized protein YdaU (DUF1376 family)